MQLSNSLFRSAAILLVVAGSACAEEHEKLLWSFSGKTDGGGPCGAVIFDTRGNLYGVASEGGRYGGGTVFELKPRANGTWSEEDLYHFNPKGPGGYSPQAPLAFDRKGNLYGTTSLGGEYGAGTVFRLVPQSDGKWKEESLHTFNPAAGDGAWPLAAVNIDAKGDVYSTTSGGGAHGAGTIFRLTEAPDGTWSESFYSFRKIGGDGDVPKGAMTLDGHGDLYGTTELGGTHGVGTVFKASVTTAGEWTEKVIHSFRKNGVDGYEPLAGPIVGKSAQLYGTTWLGGSHGSATSGGTVWELAEKDGEWTETILHDFDNDGVDGFFPITPVALTTAGSLVGTAGSGGDMGMMYGAVFELTPEPNGSWRETILHNFGMTGMDGNGPMSGLIFDASHNMYGTTFFGGMKGDGGTVFAIEKQ